jgi:hypothetical protein
MEKLTGGTLSPAYGRDYKNRMSVVQDLNTGKDFMMQTYNGRGYCSVRDLADGSFQVRNKSLAKVWVIKINSGVAS